MAACTDYLMRAYLKAPAKTLEFHTYLLAEYGRGSEFRILEALSLRRRGPSPFARISGWLRLADHRRDEHSASFARTRA
jgi:hypothetical protein